MPVDRRVSRACEVRVGYLQILKKVSAIKASTFLLKMLLQRPQKTYWYIQTLVQRSSPSHFFAIAFSHFNHFFVLFVLF